MNVNINKITINLANAGKAGAAALIPAASVLLAIFEPRARVATSAIAGAFALLIVWTLWRGGNVALPGLTLSGHRPPPAEPPAQRVAAPAASPVREAVPPPPPPAGTSSGGAGVAIGVILSLAAAAVVVLLLASASHASATSSRTPGRVQASRPAAVAQAYYAAVNQRDWPRAWQLAGGKSRDYGTAAYRQWVGGYSCTVKDHVTRITVKGSSLLVFVRALETGGVIQDYKFSYVVRHGVLTQPRMLRYTGHAPQGCGS
jgi:hypothetical protein